MASLMIQGTTSDAGKSALVTGLCRVLQRQGISVAPFKPQNMALNSAVTIDGGEIGRAQALQAQACGLAPHTDMNPVLLKPNNDIGCQVIIHGRVVSNMDAAFYHDYKQQAMAAVLQSYQRLCDQYDVVLVEGAGSPAEINLRDNDIANMGFAEAVDCPVLLIADIDRGGVFADLGGTLQLLSENVQLRIKGYVINRFRGDIKLLNPGLEWLENHTGKPIFGTLPYLHGLHLEAEDALCNDNYLATNQQTLKVIAPALPRISNHTDFDPLRLHPQVDFQFIAPDKFPPPADLVILPGSKSVAADLLWLKKQGWEAYLQKHLRYGGKLLGICGGFQILGNRLVDPQAIESPQQAVTAFGFLDFSTTLAANKRLEKRRGRLMLGSEEISGYEIHSGISEGAALANPAIVYPDGQDGAISADGQIIGCYLHGLFEHPQALSVLLGWAGLDQVQPQDYHPLREQGIDRMADAVATHLDMSAIETLLEVY